ncbi:glycosyltransferase family 61 protein [Roseovarius sp. D22-M7]|uniref:glycosyltransferase family 61 protein n=1 Tax=Roseovarius sp. D22-M7 TaxID=3127116 RepID=UPI00300FF50B
MTADAHGLPAAAITLVPGATIVPMRGPGDPACGVIDEEGAPVPAARTRLSGHRVTPDPAPPDEAITHLPGRWLYAGVGRHHFGHFLMEATPRLWALDHLSSRPDGILLIPMAGRDIAAVLRRRLGPLLTGLAQGLPMHLVETPTRVDAAVVPTQGFGHLDWSHGTPEARAYMRRHVPAIAPERPRTGPGAAKLYLSRRRLKNPSQQVPGEHGIERWMSRAGFDILHPERLSVAEQIARYRNASMIVGPDGSAFHLAAFAMPRGARVGLIQRRTRQPVFEAIARQLTGFADADLWTSAALSQSADAGDAAALQRLRSDLREAGFL